MLHLGCIQFLCKITRSHWHMKRTIHSTICKKITAISFQGETSITGLYIKRYTSSCKDENTVLKQPEHPIDRTLHKLKDDFLYFRKAGLKPRATSDYVPRFCDILVIGGGIMGSSIAYWLKQRAPEAFTLMVVEKDLSYTRSSSVLSVGGLRQQFSLSENIEMSLFGAEFLRTIKSHLTVQDLDPPDAQFNPHGYLFMSTEKGADQMKTNHTLQTKLGAKLELLSPSRLKQKFPWINTEGIELACLGLENEGWFDPWLLLEGFRKKAASFGTDFIQGEVVGFEFESMPDVSGVGVEMGTYEGLRRALIRDQNGEMYDLQFAICIIAAGAQSGEVAKMARVGTGDGLLSTALPVEPRKRYVYCFHCKDGPGIDSPMVVDPTGTYFRREGMGGYYIAGKSPQSSEEPSVDNLDVDYPYFENEVWPNLAHRISAFEAVKLKSAWAGFYEYNTFDQNAVIGPHPYYSNLYMATGFSGHGIQQAPAVGRALMELILDGCYTSIDLSRFGFERFILNIPVMEQNIV